LEQLCIFGAVTVETGKHFLKILKVDLSHDPGILLLGIYLKELKTGPQKGICTPMFLAVLFPVDKL
jgi:hypothetical protein